METVNKDLTVKQPVRWLLFMMFGIPGFGLCAGFAAYHFHWREALLSIHTRPQIDTGLDVLEFLLIVATATSVVLRVVRQAKHRGH